MMYQMVAETMPGTVLLEIGIIYINYAIKMLMFFTSPTSRLV